MGWLPFAPQLKQNPLEVERAAKAAGVEPKDHVAAGLKSGDLERSCEAPDAPENWPRNLFVWRSNLLGSSGKGHEYFLKHLLGTKHDVLGKDLGEEGRMRSRDARWHDQAPQGKLDLLVTLDSACRPPASIPTSLSVVRVFGTSELSEHRRAVAHLVQVTALGRDGSSGGFGRSVS